MDFLQFDKLTAVQIIQMMLAPAVMISACGLLLLGMNNKYSMVVNRIRLLNEEKRKILLKVGETAFTTDDNIRLEITAKQISFLVLRGRLVRNAVLSYTIAIALFVLASLLIGVSAFLSFSKLNYFIIASFLSGMFSVFIGVIFAALETKKGFDIILFEVKAHE